MFGITSMLRISIVQSCIQKELTVWWFLLMFSFSFQMLMNVNRSPQCVTVMPHVMILWGALTAHVKMDILEMEKPAMVCTHIHFHR